MTAFSSKKKAIAFLKEPRKLPCFIQHDTTGESTYLLPKGKTTCQACKKGLNDQLTCSCGAVHVVKSERLSPYLDLDQVAELLGVESFSSYDDYYIENVSCDCSEQDQDAGKCDCGFEAGRTELFRQYTGALNQIAEHLLDKHGLLLEETAQEWRKKIVPQVSWRDATKHIMMTIEGHGMFDYHGDVQEFLERGPYTAFQAVMEHLHWMKSYYEVYGDTGAKERMERAMR